MRITCETCNFSEVVAVKDQPYSYLNPFGEEVHKTHSETILVCRAMPPITGDWPRVSLDDWCGYFKSGSNSS